MSSLSRTDTGGREEPRGAPHPGRDDDPESDDAAPVVAGRPTANGPASGDAGPPDPVAEARALLANVAPRRRLWLGSRRRQVSAGVIILAAIGFLAFQGLTNATEYFQTTKQAVANRPSLGTKPFRIEGTVENDVRTAGSKLLFTIYGPGQAVNVVSTGSPSPLFKPGIPVVLEGHWQGDTYMSNLIMVKHTASYTEAHPGRLKPQVPARSATKK
jgi:cytochrome c-type biogenesis protein CcmE